MKARPERAGLLLFGGGVSSLERTLDLALARLVAERRIARTSLPPSLTDTLASLGVNSSEAEFWLDDDIEVLSSAAVQERLTGSARTWLRDLRTVLLADSTNTRLMERAAHSALDGIVMLAEAQSAGRGRRGREWYSPFGRSIALSLGLRLPLPAADLGGLSLAVGLAVADALLTLGVQHLQLKWPNDLLLQGRKLGGILIEFARSDAAHSDLVIGVGLNVSRAPGLGARVDQPVACLAESGLQLDRNQLVARLISAIHTFAARYADQGFGPMRAAWERLNAHQGAEVSVTAGDRVLSGIVLGVDDHGALLLETHAGVRVVIGGDVTLRSAVDAAQ
jgi:BirA family transcriptional regulator, biotin operon repressor / biotin---[acetyl-CoA-carboxylase] ligase